MINIQIQGDVKQVTGTLSGLGIGLQKTAITRAINRAIDSTATRANRAIRERYNLSRATVAKALRVTKASAAQDVPAATIVASGRRISIFEFGGRATKRGAITVLIRKDRGRETVRGRANMGGKPFVQTISGPRAVWQRVGKARFPVKQVKGPSIPYMFVRSAIRKAMEETATEVFTKSLGQQIKFLGGR